MQGTADVHHEITETFLPQAHAVFDDTAAFDAAVDMLNPQPALMQGLVDEFLLQRPLPATGFFGRHEDVHLGQREGQEAQIL